MAIMKSNQPLAQIIIMSARGSQGVRFVAPVELATLIIWFLVSPAARLAALMVFDLARIVYQYYRAGCAYLSDWLADLELIGLALVDLESWQESFRSFLGGGLYDKTA